MKYLTQDEMRKLAVRNIADQFLEVDDISIENRLFLLKTTLPTVVMGLESLLKEMTLNGNTMHGIRSTHKHKSVLQKDKPAQTFDSLNWLGQYLFRNNPKFKTTGSSAYEERAMEITSQLESRITAIAAEKEVLRLKEEEEARLAKEKEERERIAKLNEKRIIFTDMISNCYRSWITALWRKEPGELYRKEIIEQLILVVNSPETQKKPDYYKKVGDLIEKIESKGSQYPPIDGDNIIFDVDDPFFALDCAAIDRWDLEFFTKIFIRLVHSWSLSDLDSLLSLISSNLLNQNALFPTIFEQQLFVPKFKKVIGVKDWMQQLLPIIKIYSPGPGNDTNRDVIIKALQGFCMGREDPKFNLLKPNTWKDKEVIDSNPAVAFAENAYIKFMKNIFGEFGVQDFSMLMRHIKFECTRMVSENIEVKSTVKMREPISDVVIRSVGLLVERMVDGTGQITNLRWKVLLDLAIANSTDDVKSILNMIDIQLSNIDSFDPNSARDLIIKCCVEENKIIKFTDAINRALDQEISAIESAKEHKAKEEEEELKKMTAIQQLENSMNGLEGENVLELSAALSQILMVYLNAVKPATWNIRISLLEAEYFRIIYSTLDSLVGKIVGPSSIDSHILAWGSAKLYQAPNQFVKEDIVSLATEGVSTMLAIPLFKPSGELEINNEPAEQGTICIFGTSSLDDIDSHTLEQAAFKFSMLVDKLLKKKILTELTTDALSFLKQLMDTPIEAYLCIDDSICKVKSFEPGAISEKGPYFETSLTQVEPIGLETEWGAELKKCRDEKLRYYQGTKSIFGIMNPLNDKVVVLLVCDELDDITRNAIMRIGSVLGTTLSGKEEYELDCENSVPAVKEKIKFGKYVLQENRKSIGTIDARMVAEMKSYRKPPLIVHRILKGVLYLYGKTPKQTSAWRDTIQYIDYEFIDGLQDYDPTSLHKKIYYKRLNKIMKLVSFKESNTMGSKPTQILYEFLVTTLVLREIAVKARQTAAASKVLQSEVVDSESGSEEEEEVVESLEEDNK